MGEHHGVFKKKKGGSLSIGTRGGATGWSSGAGGSPVPVRSSLPSPVFFGPGGRGRLTTKGERESFQIAGDLDRGSFKLVSVSRKDLGNPKTKNWKTCFNLHKK